MHTHSQKIGGPRSTSEATLFRQAQVGCQDSLNALMARHDGLDGRAPAIYRQIGSTLRISGERARQLHTEALVWLRHPAHSQTLRTLLGRHTIADYQLADDLAQRWLQRRGGQHGR